MIPYRIAGAPPHPTFSPTGRRSATPWVPEHGRAAVPHTAHTMKIYLAGPLGFSEAGRFYQDTVLIPALARAGHDILNPWKLTAQSKIDAILAMPYGPARRDAWRDLNGEIGGNNRAAIDASDAVFAILDGADVDIGTACEIGYAFARRKPILGYRGDLRLSADNEGAIVNLQVEYFIRRSGGDIVASFADALARLESLGKDPR
jgi:nucleoside 2-deoxyribosyltransferase